MKKQYFPLVIIACSFIALIIPNFLVSFKSAIPYLLALVMLSVGLHVSVNDFKKVFTLKQKILYIILLKSIVTAVLAYLIAKALGLSLPGQIGLVIVGACPGGTASSVMALLARANVALVVTITFITTLLSPFVMPSIIYLFFHKSIELDALGMMETTFIIVVMPIALGVLIKLFANVDKLVKLIPFVAMVSITIIVMIVVALNTELLLSLPFKIAMAIIILSICANIIGYIIGVVLNLDISSRQALLFEFSVLDVGLGIVIATMFFGKEAALAATLYAIWQNVTAPIIASVIKKNSYTKKKC